MKGENGLRLVFTKKGFELFENTFSEILTDYSRQNQKELVNVLEVPSIKKETDHFVYIGWDFLRKFEELYLIKVALDVVEQKGYGYNRVGLGSEYHEVEFVEHKGRKVGERELPRIATNVEMDDQATYDFMVGEEICILARQDEELEV